MRFVLTDTERDLRETLADFLERNGGLDDARRCLDGQPSSRALWDSMSGDLGLPGVAIPEAAGGIGLTDVELALCLEELGATVSPAPFLVTAGFTAPALLELGLEAGWEQVAAPVSLIAAGATATLALTGEQSAGQASPGTTARRETDQWCVTGEYPRVLQADDVDYLVVPAVTPDGATALFWLESAHATVVAATGIDRTRALCTVTVREAPAEFLGTIDSATFHRVLVRMRLALAAECLGAAQRCLDMATAYAKVRQQFGRPIGQFQAIKHRLADLLVEVEMARSCVYAAACHVASRSWNEADVSVPAALAAATSALTRAARDNVQIHGGIAFTWEHDAHLFVRRAATASSLLGRAGGLHRDVYDVAALTG